MSTPCASTHTSRIAEHHHLHPNGPRDRHGRDRARRGRALVARLYYGPEANGYDTAPAVDREEATRSPSATPTAGFLTPSSERI